MVGNDYDQSVLKCYAVLNGKQLSTCFGGAYLLQLHGLTNVYDWQRMKRDTVDSHGMSAIHYTEVLINI